MHKPILRSIAYHKRCSFFIIKATCDDMQVAFFTYSARTQRKNCAQLPYNTKKPISQNRYFYEIRIF